MSINLKNFKNEFSIGKNNEKLNLSQLLYSVRYIINRIRIVSDDRKMVAGDFSSRTFYSHYFKKRERFQFRIFGSHFELLNCLENYYNNH